jgi:hypothetical protein
MKMNLTRKVLADLKRDRHDNQFTVWDAKENGLCVLVSPGAEHKTESTVTFRVCYYLRNEPGKPRYLKIGRYPDGEFIAPYQDAKGNDVLVDCSDIDAVRNAVGEIRKRAKRGIDPRHAPTTDNFKAIVEQYLEQHAAKNRTERETRRIFARYVLPEWGSLSIRDIDRDRVSALLNRIEAGKIEAVINKRRVRLGTGIVATAVLIQVSTLFNWYARQNKDFHSPVVRGMQRGKPKARQRVLNDDELRALWAVTKDDVYGAVLRCALLTAQRFHKVGNMQRSDLKDHLKVAAHFDDNGAWVEEVALNTQVWDPTRDDDPKNKSVSVVPLSRLASQIIASLPQVDGHADYVFTRTGDSPINRDHRYKQRTDAAMLGYLRKAAAAKGLDPEEVQLKEWEQRDLRRTAKTLMRRAKVDRDISERCLGHVIRGVEGVYDRYDYLVEKRDAFERLANIIERIVNPTGNVVPVSFPRKKKRSK